MPYKSQKFLVFVLTVFLAVSAIAGAGEWKSADSGGFHFEWMVDGADLNVKLSAETEGWVAIGFNPSKKMKDADIIIGCVDDGTVTIEDHYGSGQISHRSDESRGGTDNISNLSGREAGGMTELSFTIPMNSGDEHDCILREGETCRLIFASGKKDKLTSMHNRKASMEIVL